MLFKKWDHWFVSCDGDNCKTELKFAYINRESALCDIRDEKWELTPEDKCYCSKCARKEFNEEF